MSTYNFSLKEIKINAISNDLKRKYTFENSPVKVNKKLLMLKPDAKNEILIYDLQSLSFLEPFNIEDPITFADFHSHYENILLICTGRDVKIYVINIDNKNINQISTVKGNFSDVYYANFNPLEPNILLSISKNYDIKIFDMTKSLPICHIPNGNKPLDAPIIKWGINEFGFITQNNTIINYNYLTKKKKELLPFDNNINDFHFYNTDNCSECIIVLEEHKINLVNNQNEILLIYDSDYIINDNFYNRKNYKLILFTSQNITIFDIEKSQVEQTFNAPFFLRLQFIEESLLDDNLLCNGYFQNLKNYKVDTFSISIDKSTKKSNNSSDDEIKKFLKNIIKSISDIGFLLSKNNTIQIDDFQNKNYFKINEIKNELNSIKKKDIFQRREKVIKEFPHINNINLINEKYMSLLKLLVNNNTYIPLIKNYLLFIKKNKEYLKNIYKDSFEEYEKELNYYLNIINKDEAYEITEKEKISQKNELLSFMDYLLNFKDAEEFEKYLESLEDFYEKTIGFNMPLDYNNEEFFYFRNINLIKYSLKNLYAYIKEKLKEILIINKKNKSKDKDKEIKELKKKIIDEELIVLKYKIQKTKQLFQNNTVSDLEILEYLIILLIQASNKDEYDFNYNLITTEKVTVNDIKKFIGKNKDKEEDPNKGNNKNYYNKSSEKKDEKKEKSSIKDKSGPKKDKDEYQKYKDEKKNYKMTVEVDQNNKVSVYNKNIKDFQYLCLNNLYIYKNKDQYFEKKIYNYKYYKAKYEAKYRLSKIKQFYKNILPKQCFKSIYETLYGKDEYYPFENQEFTNEFIDKYYDFLPMKSQKSYAITEKYSLKMYIISFLERPEGGNMNKDEKRLLRTSQIVNTSNHEIGHNFVNNNFFMNNGRNTIETPRKHLLDVREGGYYIELALYGRILKSISIKQAIYLLNEANYNKSFLEFQEGFNNIQKEDDLKIEGIFEDEFKNIYLVGNKEGYNDNLYIPQRIHSNIPEKKIRCLVKNDIIGRFIPNEIYNKYT